MSGMASEVVSGGEQNYASPIKKLLSSSVVYGFGTILVQAINILLMPILTAHLTTSEYGAVALLNFVGLIIGAIFSWGISSSVGICYFEKESNLWKTQVIGTAFGLLIISSILLILGVYFSLDWSATWLLGDGHYRDAILYATASTAFTMLIIPFDNKLRLNAQLVRFTTASLFSTVVIAALTLWSVIELQRGVLGYFEALFLGRAFSLWIFYALSGGIHKLAFSADLSRKLLRLGVPLMPQFIILYFLQYGNIDLLKRLSSLADAGIYAAGLAVGLASNVVVSSIGNAWAPFFLAYTNRQDEAKEIFGRATKYYILGVGIFSLLFYYLAKPLMILLSAPEYFDGYKVVGPIATGMFMLGLSNMLLPPVYFAKEVGRVTYIGSIAIIIQLGLAYFLIPTSGILGAAWALICAYSTYALLLCLLNFSNQHYLKIQYQRLPLMRFCAIYFVSCFGLSFARISPYYLEVMAFVIHFVIMSILALKTLDKPEFASIKQLVRKFVPFS